MSLRAHPCQSQGPYLLGPHCSRGLMRTLDEHAWQRVYTPCILGSARRYRSRQLNKLHKAKTSSV